MNWARPHFGEAVPAHPACLQDADELAGLIALFKRENVRRYLEVGARYGGTFETIMMALPPSSRGMAIDLPGGHFGDANSGEILTATAARLRLVRRWAQVVFGSSASPLVQRRARTNAPYDAIMIDADHSYEAVKRDFAAYAPMGRIIVLHDIAAPQGYTSRAGHKVEVPRFWREIKKLYHHEAILGTNTLMGIGVIYTDRPTAQSER